MEDNKVQKEAIGVDWRLVCKKIFKQKRLYYKTLPIAFVLSCLFIISIPRYYTSELSLAPEMESSGAGGALSSIASSFGFDIGDMQTSDAITPLLYPDLIEDNGFTTSLFNIKVQSKEGDIKTTYHDYLKKYQKNAWWAYPVSWIKSLFKSPAPNTDAEMDPYNLSKEEDKIAQKIRKNIKITVDKKTAVITINVKAQDPLICKTVADSVKGKLQEFITNYRTNKARTDYEYYKDLAAEAKRDYEKARQYYGSLSDANSRVALKSVELKMEDLENDMQLKFNAYSTLSTQLQAAKAKVQERTPAFTVIKGAAVPIKPAGPKRMIFVAVMLFLTFIGTSVYILRDIIR